LSLEKLTADLALLVDYDCTPVNLVPERYFFGGPKFWRMTCTYNGQTLITYWNGHAQATDPTFAEWLEAFRDDCLSLRQYKTAAEMGEDRLSKPEHEYMHLEWQEHVELMQKTWKVMKEERTQFLAIFGPRWYRKLMQTAVEEE
jgi:hypothetical protein